MVTEMYSKVNTLMTYRSIFWLEGWLMPRLSNNDATWSEREGYPKERHWLSYLQTTTVLTKRQECIFLVSLNHWVTDALLTVFCLHSMMNRSQCIIFRLLSGVSVESSSISHGIPDAKQYQGCLLKERERKPPEGFIVRKRRLGNLNSSKKRRNLHAYFIGFCQKH